MKKNEIVIKLISSGNYNQVPIKANGCTILFVISGYAILTINLKRYVLKKQCLLFAFFDETFSIDKISKNFVAQLISFPYEYVEDTFYKIPTSYFWEITYDAPVYYAPTYEWNLFNNWWKQMKWINKLNIFEYKKELFKSSFYTLFLAMEGYIISNRNLYLKENKNKSWKFIIDFFILLPKFCRKNREVNFYASKLCISSTYLYKLCRKELQMSPKELIDKQTISEIKNFLTNTNWTIQRIALEFNFEDSSYFCRYFHKKIGITPLEYRKSFSD